MSKKNNTNNELSCYTKMPNESNKSFNEYCKIRDLPPHERTLRKVAERNIAEKGVLKSHKNYPSELKKELSRLLKLSERWRWQERFRLYDLDKQIDLMKKRDDLFYNLNGTLLDVVEGLIKYANNLLAELIGGAKKQNGEDFSLGTRMKMLNEITMVIERANNLLCDLCGRSRGKFEFDVDLTGNMDMNIKSDETEEERLERYASYFEQINSKATSKDSNNSTQ